MSSYRSIPLVQLGIEGALKNDTRKNSERRCCEKENAQGEAQIWEKAQVPTKAQKQEEIQKQTPQRQACRSEQTEKVLILVKSQILVNYFPREDSVFNQ